MKHRPVHQNLDTSFINLPALVRYLRQRGFTGKIHVEMSDYEANVYLSEPDGLRAVEHDRVAGRVAEGEDALQRILIRSREPGGAINVYEEVAENEISAPEIEAEKLSAPQSIQNIKPISAQFAKQTDTTQNPPAVEETATPQITSLPLEFSNKYEEKARQAHLSPEEWQTLLNLTGELLGAVDKTLSDANLDFAAAFQKARAEISADYPFLSPNSGAFEYRNGKIEMSQPKSPKLFIASMTEILQRILEKLAANPNLDNVRAQAKQNLNSLINQRKSLYDKFSITAQLEKLAGI